MTAARNSIIDQLRGLLGDDGVREEDQAGLPRIIVKPRDTGQVSGVLKLCNDAGQALVPIGGRTGLVGGLTPTAGEIGLSLERMAAIEEVDTDNRTMTVQAG